MNVLKQKPKKVVLSNLVYSSNFTFYKYHNTKEFPAKRFIDLKQDD